MNIKLSKKQVFVRIVDSMSAGDPFLIEVADLVDEQLLPSYPGIAALELVTSLQGLKEHWQQRVSASCPSRAERRNRLLPAPARTRRNHPATAMAPLGFAQG